MLFAKGETFVCFVYTDVDIVREHFAVLLDGCRPSVLFPHMLAYVEKLLQFTDFILGGFIFH